MRGLHSLHGWPRGHPLDARRGVGRGADASRGPRVHLQVQREVLVGRCRLHAGPEAWGEQPSWQLQGQTQPCWQQQALCFPSDPPTATIKVGGRVAKLMTLPQRSLLRCQLAKPPAAADTVQQEGLGPYDAPSRCTAEAVWQGASPRMCAFTLHTSPLQLLRQCLNPRSPHLDARRPALRWQCSCAQTTCGQLLPP